MHWHWSPRPWPVAGERLTEADADALERIFYGFYRSRRGPDLLWSGKIRAYRPQNILHLFFAGTFQLVFAPGGGPARGFGADAVRRMPSFF